MGFLISMRDEPMDAEIPKYLEPDPYYKGDVESTLKRIEELYSMTPIDTIEAAALAYEKEEQYFKDMLEKAAERRSRYLKMEENLHSWVPFDSALINLRSFALSQLNDSSIDYSTEFLSRPEILSGKEWLEKELASEYRLLASRSESLAKELKRNSEVNDVLMEFHNELTRLSSQFHP